jgi:hypothetical protein
VHELVLVPHLDGNAAYVNGSIVKAIDCPLAPDLSLDCTLSLKRPAHMANSTLTLPCIGEVGALKFAEFTMCGVGAA